MARISKAEHARILQLVDVDRQKVTDVAAEYGCTPANIYAVLGKLRRGDGGRWA
jgi:transposase-like protein